MLASDKLSSTFRYEERPIYTTSNGCPVQDPESSLRQVCPAELSAERSLTDQFLSRVGQNGPLLLQDFHLLDLLAHFDRERIPERVVHAKGAGAYGEFEVTHDISDLTSVDMLNGVGKKAKCVARFSTVGGEKGSADSARDPRGFSIKFYTEEGNWDWVFNNTPVFFLRDPSKFPIFIHTQKRNPQTNLKDATMFWDYLSTHQESAHQVMQLFSDRGTPYSYRHMNGYSGHTYKLTKPDGTFNYVQMHCKTDQGIKNFTNEEAVDMAAANPDHHTQDLFDAIDKHDYPSWTCYLQVLSPEQAEKFRWNIFDLTKVWPQMEVPLRPFGKFTLTRNAENYFAEIEQVAFSPSHMVPGVEPSADPVLQSRLFSYPDTQRHRLGVNYQQIPVNAPLRAFNPYQRDGIMAVNGNYGANPNYPSTYRNLSYKPVKPSQEHEKWAGAAVAQQIPVTEEDYVQPKVLWCEVLGRQPGQQERFVGNVAGHLCGAKEPTRRRTYGMFAAIDWELGVRVERETERRVAGVGSKGDGRGVEGKGDGGGVEGKGDGGGVDSKVDGEGVENKGGGGVGRAEARVEA